MRVGLNPAKTRLFAAIVIAGSMFLPLATCTRNGRVETYVPFRDAELGGVLLVFAIPLLLALIDFFSRAQWVRVIALALEPIAGAFSTYIVWVQVMLRTPTWWFYLLLVALATYFIAAAGGLAREVKALRAASRTRSLSPPPSPSLPIDTA